MHFSHILIIVVIMALNTSSKVFAQSDNVSFLPPIISLLLDGDECITPIRVGDVVFDTLDPECESTLTTTGSQGDVFARYFSFTHPGGPLHIDLLIDLPVIFDAVLGLRDGDARDGALIDSDDNGHSDFRSSRLVFQNLAAGRYTIEATTSQTNSNLEGNFNLSVYGNLVTANPTGRLNDTGIAFSGAGLSINSATCNGVGDFAEQDCNFGRDSNSVLGRGSSVNDNDGHDGFSFLKVSSSGAPLLEDAMQWSCVKDNVTGLIWEVKTLVDTGGLHDLDNTYSWFDTNPVTNGGADGVANGGACFDSNCDTQSFVAAVNTAGLCGHNNWRMPTVTELQSIVNYNTSSPAIDTAFFPNTADTFFLSASPVNNDMSRAWGVTFDSGDVSDANRIFDQRVRLVSGGQ